MLVPSKYAAGHCPATGASARTVPGNPPTNLSQVQRTSEPYDQLREAGRPAPLGGYKVRLLHVRLRDEFVFHCWRLATKAAAFSKNSAFMRNSRFPAPAHATEQFLCNRTPHGHRVADSDEIRRDRRCGALSDQGDAGHDRLAERNNACAFCNVLRMSCQITENELNFGDLTIDERDRLVERRPARTGVIYRDVLEPDRHATEEDELIRG